MKRKWIIILGLLVILAYAFSQEKKHFSVTKSNQDVEKHFSVIKSNQSIDETNSHKFKLFNNHYYHGFDGCDIFVDNLYLNGTASPGINVPDVNAVFIIEPSLSYHFEEMIKDLPIKRAVMQMSFICSEDNTVSIKINDISLRDSNFDQLVDKDLEKKVKEFMTKIKCKVLLRNSKRVYYSCAILFASDQQL